MVSGLASRCVRLCPRSLVASVWERGIARGAVRNENSINSNKAWARLSAWKPGLIWWRGLRCRAERCCASSAAISPRQCRAFTTAAPTSPTGPPPSRRPTTHVTTGAQRPCHPQRRARQVAPRPRCSGIPQALHRHVIANLNMKKTDYTLYYTKPTTYLLHTVVHRLQWSCSTV